jgi:hypothetical protein
VESLTIHFHGPLTFAAGPHCLFTSEFSRAACIYLWTIKSEIDGKYWIHYVGETGDLRMRQKEHLIRMLGLNYGILDVAEARRGVATFVWRGIWRAGLPDGPSHALDEYPTLAPAVAAYVDALAVLVAPLDVGRSMREHHEGSVASNLRSNHDDCCSLYPRDCRTGCGVEAGIRLEITSDQPIAGLDALLSI